MVERINFNTKHIIIPSLYGFLENTNGLLSVSNQILSSNKRDNKICVVKLKGNKCRKIANIFKICMGSFFVFDEC